MAFCPLKLADVERKLRVFEFGFVAQCVVGHIFVHLRIVQCGVPHVAHVELHIGQINLVLVLLLGIAGVAHGLVEHVNGFLRQVDVKSQQVRIFPYPFHSAGMNAVFFDNGLIILHQTDGFCHLDWRGGGELCVTNIQNLHSGQVVVVYAVTKVNDILQRFNGCGVIPIVGSQTCQLVGFDAFGLHPLVNGFGQNQSFTILFMQLVNPIQQSEIAEVGRVFLDVFLQSDLHRVVFLVVFVVHEQVLNGGLGLVHVFLLVVILHHCQHFFYDFVSLVLVLIQVNQFFGQQLRVVHQSPTFLDGFDGVVDFHFGVERAVEFLHSILLGLKIFQQILILFLRFGIVTGTLIYITQIHFVPLDVREILDLFFNNFFQFAVSFQFQQGIVVVVIDVGRGLFGLNLLKKFNGFVVFLIFVILQSKFFIVALLGGERA